MANLTIKSSRIYIYPEDARTHCEDIANESTTFLNTLKEFHNVFQRVTKHIKDTSRAVEYKKKLVIGLRNAIEIEHESCKQRCSQLESVVGEKTDILKRLQLEYNALEDVIMSQDMEKRSISNL